MLGQDLRALLEQRHRVFPLSRSDADITDGPQIARVIEQARPEVAIHAAALTEVDACELHPELAFRVNAEGTRNVSQVCGRLDIAMLYVSTDYVFDGEKSEPYLETDSPHPLSVYGKSKLQGEEYVREFVGRSWIVRTSWLFGPLGKNFVEAILDRARSGAVLRVVEDQIGSPTYTEDLAVALEQIIERGTSGIYHVSNQGACSRFDFAREIFRQRGLDPSRISAIATSASDRPARRPKNSRLGQRRLLAEKLPLLPAWQDALGRYLARAAP